MKNIFTLIVFMLVAITLYAKEPLKVAVVGMTHDHVHGILGRADIGDIEIVGMVEENPKRVKDLAERYGFSLDLVYNTMDDMLAKVEPEAVCAFGSIYDHLKVVEVCAPLGIHVMVEKPLAVSVKHATKMEKLAKVNNIQLLTNYETTWYATHHKMYDMVENGDIGPLRKVVVHDGHEGPREIGCSEEFLAWLTDPVLNGGGAVIDFGCYGANLITWLRHGEKPESIFAVTQTIKPDVYPKVDDEATIVLKYSDMQGIVQASWNWPFGRKDMQVYGKTGYIFADNRSDMRYKLDSKSGEKSEKLDERKAPLNDAFSYFAGVIDGSIKMQPFALSSLENNMIVVEILETAKTSAKTGKTVKLK